MGAPPSISLLKSAKIETSLMRSTKPQVAPGTQEPRKTQTQEGGKPVSQEARNPGTQKNIKRASYPKKTYNLHPDVIDMVEELKRKLERHYAIKVSREEIVEAAIRQACDDFQQSQETSLLVLQFTRNPGTQDT
jgi:hypothetical protein